jgi:4-amino-4-deoxy-L-arabinose transferase-like glycosyltransferase
MSTATIPTWRLAAESFVPEKSRKNVGWLIGHAPLLFLLLLQAVFSLRLDNSAFQDEALYIFTGHWLIDSWRSDQEVFSNPESFFSGAPYLYPVFAALLDSLGGLWLVRSFSCLCMLSSTVAVYWTTNLLFGHRSGVRPGTLAAAIFVLNAPVIFLGNFATFDAPAFTMMAWAMAFDGLDSTRAEIRLVGNSSRRPFGTRGAD